jgi:hypothetical protein
VNKDEGESRDVVVMTNRTMFVAAEGGRERAYASFPVCIEDRGVDRDPVREDGVREDPMRARAFAIQRPSSSRSISTVKSLMVINTRWRKDRSSARTASISLTERTMGKVRQL